MKIHSFRVHKTHKVQLTCAVCNKGNNTMQKLKKRIRNGHESERKQSNRHFSETLFGDDETIVEFVRSKSHSIGDHVIQQPHQTIFNFVLKQSGYDKIKKCMDTTFQKLSQTSKINMCFGYLLKNTKSND